MATPKRKSVPERSRKNIVSKRNKARNQHYQMLKTVKEYNLRGEPVTFKELCLVEHYHEVAEFIREAESWSMIESKPLTREGFKIGIELIVTNVGDRFLSYYEQRATYRKT